MAGGGIPHKILHSRRKLKIKIHEHLHITDKKDIQVDASKELLKNRY